MFEANLYVKFRKETRRSESIASIWNKNENNKNICEADWRQATIDNSQARDNKRRLVRTRNGQEFGQVLMRLTGIAWVSTNDTTTAKVKMSLTTTHCEWHESKPMSLPANDLPITVPHLDRVSALVIFECNLPMKSELFILTLCHNNETDE